MREMGKDQKPQKFGAYIQIKIPEQEPLLHAGESEESVCKFKVQWHLAMHCDSK